MHDKYYRRYRCRKLRWLTEVIGESVAGVPHKSQDPLAISRPQHEYGGGVNIDFPSPYRTKDTRLINKAASVTSRKSQVVNRKPRAGPYHEPKSFVILGVTPGNTISEIHYLGIGTGTTSYCDSILVPTSRPTRRAFLTCRF